ncbi:MAG: hypothetical protein P4M00_24565 [Azospirillaceae bacterium]|nr:hypothetical protein [Azospirillaceae bacterium]
MMVRLGISARIILLLQIAVGFALGSTILLFYFKMEALVEETVSSRFVVVSNGVAHEIESALNLGLKLTELKNLDAILNRELSRESRITGMTLFTNRGEIVTSAGSAALSGSLPSDWLRTLLRDQKAEPQATLLVAAGSQVIMSPMRDPIGGIAGGIALTYSLSAARESIHRTIPTIVLGGAVCLILSLGVTMIAVWITFRPTQRRIHQTLDYLQGLAAGATGAVPVSVAALAPGLDQFAIAITAARATLDAADATDSQRSAP